MMKQYIGIFLLGFTFAIGSAQNSRSLSTFDEIKVATGVRVTLVESNTHKAIVEVENCSQEEVITEVKGDKLVVKFADQKGGWGKHRNRKAHVTVHFKTLNEIGVSSGGMIETQNRLSSENLSIEGSSGGQMDLMIEGVTVQSDISSGAVIKLDGQAESLVVDVSSGGVFSGYDFKTKKATADASSGGVAKIMVTDDLRADASSGGSVNYKGSPAKIDIDKSISGSVRARS